MVRGREALLQPPATGGVEAAQRARQVGLLRESELSSGAGSLRVLGQLEDVPGPYGADTDHDRCPVGRFDGQRRDARALLALKVGVVARAAQCAN
jgi:hypothetical protein